MSKKREAEREAWKERKQALNNIQQQNDELYALRIVDLDKHPLLQGITNTREYKKIHRQLQNAALTQDIWAEGFTLNNNSSNLNVSLNQESSVLKQDVLPIINNLDVLPVVNLEELKWGGPVTIKIGGSKITVKTKEEADNLLEELSKNTPSYNQDKYQESLNNLKSILYTGLGNTKMHSNIIMLLSGLSRLQSPSSDTLSSVLTVLNGVKSETDKTPNLWNAVIQNAYGGKYDPNIVLSGADTRDYNTRFEIYKNAIKLIDPTIITEGKTEDQINNELFKKGLFDVNAAAWLLGSPDYNTKGVVKEEEEVVYDPYAGNIYKLYIHPNYKLLGSDENGEGGYGDYFKDQGIILVENSSGQVHVLDISKLDSTNKYYALKDLSGADYTFNTLGYDKNFVKDNVMLFKDSQGNYRIGKIGDPVFTYTDHKAIRDYLNSGIKDHYSDYLDTYTIGNKEHPNKYYETIFNGKQGEVLFMDITGFLPEMGPNYNGYYGIVSDFSTIAPDGKFNNTPFVFFNPETNDLKTFNITTLSNGYYRITNLNGEVIAEGDSKYGSNYDTEAMWYVNGENIEPEVISPETTDRVFRLKNEDLALPPINELMDDGSYDYVFKTADAHTNNVDYYASKDEKVINVAKTILTRFKNAYTEGADKHKKQYAYFALQVITKAGGRENLKRLGFADEEINSIYYRLDNWVYEPLVESNKQGGILKAQKGLTIQQKRALEEEYRSNKKEEQEKIKSQELLNKEYRTKKRIDFSSELNSGDDKGARIVDYGTLGLDAISTVASFFPGVGTAISAVCGIASSAWELAVDLDNGDESAWKDFGVNMAFTVLGLVPGLKAGKLVKSSTKLMNVAEYAKDALKYTAGAEKVLNLSEKTLGKAVVDLPELKTIINNAKGLLHQTDNVLKDKGLLESTVSSIWNGTKTIADLTTKVLAGAAVVNGAVSTTNVIKDARSGEAPDVYDLKGILGGVSGFGALRANVLNSLAKKSLKQLGNSGNLIKTIKGKIYSGNNQLDIDIEITPGMNKSSVDKAIRDKAIKMRDEANIKMQSLETSKAKGDLIDEEELIKVKTLYNKLNTILTDTRLGISTTKTSFDEFDLKFDKNTLGYVLDDRFNNDGYWLEKQGYKWADKKTKHLGWRDVRKTKGYLTDSEYSQLSDDVTKELDDLLEIIDELENSSDLKVNIKNGEKIIDLLNALKAARIQLPLSITAPNTTAAPVIVSPQSSVPPVPMNKKGGQLYNSKEVDSLVNLKKKDITKYKTPAGPIKIGNLKLTNLNFYKDYNIELLLYYDELVKNGQLTPEKVEELNKLFSDKQALNAWAKNQGYDRSKAIRHKSGNVKAYLDKYHNLGLHTNSFKTGWDKNYSNSSFNEDSNNLTNSELWNQDGTFISDDDFGEKTYHRNANYMTDEELAQRNAIWENTGYKWELMEGSEVGEDGRKFYNIVPTDVKEVELDGDDDEKELTLTYDKPEYSRPKGFSWAPFKVGADTLIDHQANKDILEASYQDAPPGRNYLGVNKKVTDNFISRWMAAKNAGELNAQAAFLANNTADIDKANAIKLQGYKQGLDAIYDSMMKSYDEYKRTSAEQEDLRRKYDLQNNEIKYQNDMQLYLNKLINKNRFVQFLNANKASRRNALNYLDSRLIEEQKAYTDLHNRDLMAIANRNKSIALTMAENDYYNSLEEAKNVDIEFNNYLESWKKDSKNAIAYANGDIPTMDSIIPGSNPPETFNQRKQRILANAIVLFKNKQNIALSDYEEAKNYTLPFINHLYQWVPDISRPYRYEQGGSLDFKEKKELLRLKSGYQQLRETVKDILKSIDNGEKQLDRISSGLSKERLLLLKNMLK